MELMPLTEVQWRVLWQGVGWLSAFADSTEHKSDKDAAKLFESTLREILPPCP